MIAETLWEFAALETYLTAFEPLTPFVKKDKKSFVFHKDLELLNSLYADVEIFLPFVKEQSNKYSDNKIDALETSLRKLPDFPVNYSNLYSTDIHLIKKFLIHIEKICTLLPENIPSHFNLKFESQELLTYLCLSSTCYQDESFFLSDNYSPELRKARNELRIFDKNLSQLKNHFFNSLLTSSGIDFRNQDFLVINTERARDLSKESYSFEPFDAQHFIIKPNYPKEIIDSLIEREALLKRERDEENSVLSQISEKIALEKEKLVNYQSVITRIDIAYAKAKMTLKQKLSKPQLKKYTESAQIRIDTARLIPLENQCKEQELQYWPLTVNIKDKTNVVIGSNMGGKTVVLRTVLFCQLLAQYGFFVPAMNFDSCIFENIAYVGTGTISVNIQKEGLSSFGYEIRDFIKAWNLKDKPLLLFIDEFARTTNSLEASAILSAVLTEFTRETNIFCLLSTHFADLKLPSQGASLFRMRGLAREAYEKYYATRAHLGFGERINLIHKFMQYEIADETSNVFDALNIAEILGLDNSIIARARQNIEKKE